MEICKIKADQKGIDFIYQPSTRLPAGAATDAKRLRQVPIDDRQKQSEGTGLGLAISQKIVTLMGSKIEASSQLGRGSEFSFSINLPLTTDWAAQQASLEESERIIGYEGDRRTILVVDDRLENRSVLSKLLEPDRRSGKRSRRDRKTTAGQTQFSDRRPRSRVY
ncbi:MAG: ATP-binding protein [Cyanobacteria bacterium P01_E01_bin.42]